MANLYLMCMYGTQLCMGIHRAALYRWNFIEPYLVQTCKVQDAATISQKHGSPVLRVRVYINL